MAICKRPTPEPHFHLFSLLPAELRLSIWSLNLPQSRIVTIRCGPRAASSLAKGNCDAQLVQCTSSSSIPVNLHVCHESRVEALKRYKVLFGVGGQPGKVYFDPMRDTLYFGVRDGFAGSEAHLNAFVGMISAEDRSLIEHVAINEVLIRDGTILDWSSTFTPPATPQMATEKLVCQIQSRLRNLKQITFVCGDSNPLYSSDSIFVDPDQKNRLVERRIRDAIQKLGQKYPRFAPPSWDIRAIAAEPDRPIYDQNVLGYRGSRLPFLCPPAREALAAWQCACNYCGQPKIEPIIPSTKRAQIYLH
ncbi:hypothetical protein F5Y16DRAFT_249215 [Xylariaceae sp. FL0255]|nr:hypothetical protein F5Y16DRAFT_249215 [Xylariaceae sp. FL0255]